MEKSESSAVPGNAIFGLACIGFPPVDTAGFWFEMPKAKDEWIEIKPIPAYTSYSKE